MPTPRIYLAGPLGFSEAGRLFQEKIAKRFADADLQAIDPFKLTSPEKIAAIEKLPTLDDRQAAWRSLNPIIAAANREAIDQSHAVLAVLDGPDVDSGTASEIGYAFARGKPIVGYRGDFRIAADNIGSVVNLQVEYFIRESGGVIVTTIDEACTVAVRILRQNL